MTHNKYRTSKYEHATEGEAQRAVAVTRRGAGKNFGKMRTRHTHSEWVWVEKKTD